MGDVASAWLDGYHAALRIEKYKGATKTPKCPWPESSSEREEWLDGFGTGTEDLIAWKNEGN